MNDFQIAADASHLLAVLLISYKLLKAKSAAGVSGNTQILYGIAICTRYDDLLIFISLYDVLKKIFFICMPFFIVYLIFFRYRKTYGRKHDPCRIEYLEVPCLVLAFLFNEAFTYFKIRWAFSIYLEAVAIIPQIVLICKAGRAERYIIPYIMLLGIYKALYIFNWMDRCALEGYYNIISYRSGLVQTLIYFGFLIYYALYIKGKTETKHNYSANLSEYVNNEKLLQKRKNLSSSDIPSVFIIGSKKSYAYPKEMGQDRL